MYSNISINNSHHIKLAKRKKTELKIYDAACLNCGHPFSGHEKFCPECGQENKGSKITFKNFVHELFNGFFNFDAKFWRTLIPLLTNPGKVSKDYIDGKRQRYTNPFRFYLAVSIIFFLLVGLSFTKDKYDDLSNGTSTEILNFNLDAEDDNTIVSEKKLNEKEVDSIKKIVTDEIDKSWIPIPDEAKKEVLKEIDSNAIKPKKKIESKEFSSSNSSLEKLYYFQKKNPEAKMDHALDSLKLEKNFKNRFLFTRAEYISNLVKNKDGQRQFINQLLSYGSVALFIMLPFFTLFLKLFYIRRKFTYVDHLIFVFHTQTVFFMIFSIVFILKLFGFHPETGIFLLLFLLYLLIALKKFYQQGYFKTFIKFLLLNFSFTIIASIGIAIVSVVSFALA